MDEIKKIANKKVVGKMKVWHLLIIIFVGLPMLTATILIPMSLSNGSNDNMSFDDHYNELCDGLYDKVKDVSALEDFNNKTHSAGDISSCEKRGFDMARVREIEKELVAKDEKKKQEAAIKSCKEREGEDYTVDENNKCVLTDEAKERKDAASLISSCKNYEEWGWVDSFQETKKDGKNCSDRGFSLETTRKNAARRDAEEAATDKREAACIAKGGTFHRGYVEEKECEIGGNSGGSNSSSKPSDTELISACQKYMYNYKLYDVSGNMTKDGNYWVASVSAADGHYIKCWYNPSNKDAFGEVIR